MEETAVEDLNIFIDAMEAEVKITAEKTNR